MKSLYKTFNLYRVGIAVVVLCCNYGLWFSLQRFPQFCAAFIPNGVHYTTVLNFSHGLLFISIYNVIASVINAVTKHLYNSYHESTIWPSIKNLMRAFKAGVFVISANIAAFTIGVPASIRQEFSQANHVIMLVILGWCLFEAVQVGEAVVLQHLSASSRADKDIRTRYTHIVIIKRLFMLLLAVAISAAILMTFETVRTAGAAILASAGIFSTVIALSAKPLLESVFKGLQLASTQPISLGDIVTMQGETGTVASITLHHVVITLSDKSQLIVPTGEFLEKAFRNWTHASDDLTGSFVFSVSSRVPIESIRSKFKEILKSNEYWDQNIGEVSVVSFKKNVIELKLTMGVKNGRKLSKLKNTVIEQLLEFMQTSYPDSLVG